MIILRDMCHQDYTDVVEICKDIWEGTDYLPSLFHGWVDDKTGIFIAAVDTDTNKVIGTDKYSILSDGTGWLEGIRIHKDYRGRKIAKLLTARVIEHALKDLQEGRVQKVAFSTHVSAVESISMMKQYGFRIEQQHIIVKKDFDKLSPGADRSDFAVQPWSITYEEFANLPFIKRRGGIFHIAFYFQKPTAELFNYLKEHNCFVNINGYNGIYLLKGEPHFITEEESFHAIDTFADYYLLELQGRCSCPALLSVIEEDIELLDKLKAADYSVWNDWNSDYYYFVMK